MLTVGIGEYKISNQLNETIMTHALGSCIALIMYCPITKHTALAHIVLPKTDHRDQSEILKNKPGYFADLIVPQLADYFLNIPCHPSQLQIYLAGGADSLNEKDVFKVGKRNVEMVMDILRNYQLVPYKMDVGGNISRTVSVDVDNGRVTIKSQNMII